MARPPQRIYACIVTDKPADKEYDAILRVTGQLVVEWAAMDDLLARILSCLAECSSDAARVIYYTPSNFATRLDMVFNLIRQCMPPGPEKMTLEGVLRKLELERLHKTRNDLIHSRVGFSHDLTRKPSRSIVQRANYGPARAIAEQNFKAQAHDISQHLDTLNTVWQFLHFACAPHPQSASAVLRWAAIALSTAVATSS